MHQCTAWPGYSPFWVLPVSQFGKFSMTTLHPCLHSSLSIATCLGRWRLLASRLSPFLPASDPRLPDARQGKVLSLHHLEGKVFTYMNTQLSRYNDLAAHPLYLAIQFRANGSHTKRAADVWESARFTGIFLALGFSYISSRVHAHPHAADANR